MKCLFCGAEVELGKRCEYCGSRAEPAYYNSTVPEKGPAERTLTAGSTYTAKHGDTLWAIAKAFYGSGAEYMRIAKKNRIKNPNLIYPGQVLKI